MSLGNPLMATKKPGPPTTGVVLLAQPAADATSYPADDVGRPLTYVGDAHVAGGSVVLDGNGDYVTTPMADELDLSVMPAFTIEAIVNITLRAAYHAVCSTRNNVEGFSLRIESSGALRMFFLGSGSVQTSAVVPLDTDTYVFASKTAEGVGMVSVGTSSVSSAAGAFSSGSPANQLFPFMIGTEQLGGSPLIGSIKALRITAGAALAPTIPSSFVKPW